MSTPTVIDGLTDERPAEILDLLAAQSPRASAFIVTIYGDVAAPRGGILWMGTLIECCAAHGISESLVRTAVSRLVENGRLAGERIGRRSYYRLTKAAEAEFSRAADRLYAPPPLPARMLLALGQRDLAEGWVRIGPEAALAPEGTTPPDGVVMATQGLAGVGDLPAIAARLWPLEDVAEAYRAFIATFAEIDTALADGENLGGATALALRLRLVHLYRAAALADPRLPADAVGADWPAGPARALFVKLYLKIAAAADRHIGLVFRNSDGFLPDKTESTSSRLAALRHERAQ